MKTTLSALGLLVFVASLAGTHAFQAPGNTVAIDKDDIGGIVTGPRGPEAGVWVIAETGDLPTSFVKIVVTDDQGRYLIPDLPTANYDVWVRGYGLVDSPKVKTGPGKTLNLTRGGCAQPQGSGAVLPRRLLALSHPRAGSARVSWNGSRGKRHRAGHEKPV